MATEYTVRTVMVIPSADQIAANIALNVAGFGPSTFKSPLCLSTDNAKTAPATHYVSNWAMTPVQRARVESVLTISGIWSRIFVTDLNNPDPVIAKPSVATILSGLGVKRKQSDPLKS